jgi:hypothetical protein
MKFDTDKFIEKAKEEEGYSIAAGVPEPSEGRDIVERLRDYDACHDGDVDEAADEIVRLRKENRMLYARIVVLEEQVH